MLESERIEFKSRFTDELYKEIIAFANTGGGTIYVGADDAGVPVSLNDVDDVYTRMTNGIRDAIAPDVTMFVQFTLQEEQIIRINVSEGSNKPYYLKGKGLKPSGVYVRQGASSAPASAEQIRRMIKESDGDQFESMRSIEQELSFSAAASAFKTYGVEFGPEKYRALGMLQNNGTLFTNLALLLSDQCMHSTKIAVFHDDANTEFSDSKEFGGSVFTQLEGAFSYLRLCNRTHARIQGLTREEQPDYPEEALREALLNALVHRDYSFSGSIIINVNEREIEFISIGGLLPGLSAEDIRAGISQPRNKNLAEIFHRLRLIESYGTGIRRIYALYADCPRQPRITLTPNTFKMVLPNMNAGSEMAEKNIPAATPQMQTILNQIGRNGRISAPEIEALLGVKRTRAYTLAREMTELGLIRAEGRGKNKIYRRNANNRQMMEGISPL